jgi:signal peptidase I
MSADTASSRRWRVVLAVMVLGAAIGVVLAAMYVLPAALGHRRYRIPSATMLPTLPIGTSVTGNARAYDDAAPGVGDIVIFHPPAGAGDYRCGSVTHSGGTPCARAYGGRSSATYIKRIVAVGGDRIAVRGGRVVRNGRVGDEPRTWLRKCRPQPDLGPDSDADPGRCSLPKAITVPRGQVYLLGDDRGESSDSRVWGPVPVGWIVSRVDRCGFLTLSCHPRR